MITLEQHLKAHTYHEAEYGMGFCRCHAWEESGPAEDSHAAHVAATWREEQSAVIERAKSMVGTIDFTRAMRVSPAYPDATYRRMIADLLGALTGEVQA